MGKITKLSGTNVGRLFQQRYLEKYGEAYLINYPMVKSVDKIIPFWTLEQIEICLDYYFANRGRHNLWDFISEIDKLYNSHLEDERAVERIEKLKRLTKEKLHEIESE